MHSILTPGSTLFWPLATPRRCQLFGSGSVLGSCFRVKNLPRFLPRFLDPVLEPSSVWFSVFMRNPEFFLDIPWYPQFWSIFVDIPWFSRSFWSVLLEPSSVLEPVLEPAPEPSSVWFLVLPSCQEPYFGLCHGLFQRVQISTLRFRLRSIPPSYTPSSTWFWPPGLNFKTEKAIKHNFKKDLNFLKKNYSYNFMVKSIF